MARNRRTVAPNRVLLLAASEALCTLPEEIGCDDCSERLPAYAEAAARRRRLPPSLRKVADHLDRCRDCREEWNLLRKSLRTPARVRGKIS